MGSAPPSRRAHREWSAMPDSSEVNVPALMVLHGKRANEDDVRDAVAKVRGGGQALDVRVTWESGDAERFARGAVRAGVGTVIAAGGDGTVNEVVRGLMDEAAERPGASLPVLGIVPLGTANDFATAAEIPADPLDALRLALDGSSHAVDVGHVKGRWFLNVATGGFGSEASASTSEELKGVLGRAAYLLTGLAQMGSVEPVQVRVAGPGFRWSGLLLVLAVGNARTAGGGHLLCPDALVDDGHLDVRLIPESDSGAFGTALAALLAGGAHRLEEQSITARLPWVEVAAPDGLHVNLDGEAMWGRSFRFEAVPGRLRVRLPEGCPLVGERAGGQGGGAPH